MNTELFNELYGADIDQQFVYCTGYRCTLHYMHPTTSGYVILEYNAARADGNFDPHLYDVVVGASSQYAQLLGIEHAFKDPDLDFSRPIVVIGRGHVRRHIEYITKRLMLYNYELINEGTPKKSKSAAYNELNIGNGEWTPATVKHIRAILKIGFRRLNDVTTRVSITQPTTQSPHKKLQKKLNLLTMIRVYQQVGIVYTTRKKLIKLIEKANEIYNI